MKNSIYRLISKLGYRIENRKKADQVKANAISKYEVSKGKNLLIKSFRFVQNIQRKFPELRISDHKAGVLLEFDSLKIYVETYEELFIIDEVFVQNTYNFFHDKKSILVDIGANIGTSALYFSKLPNIQKIYAFEPVPQSFEQAKQNLALNAISEDKVEIYNTGLADQDKAEIFLFNSNVKGNTGIRGKSSTSFQENNVVETEVVLKDSTVELQKIIDAHPNYAIVIKMDCEGGEYPIFKNIFDSGILKKIDCLMIEWHDKGATEIEDYLRKSDFQFFSQNLAFNSGMIYAFKK